MRCRVLPDARDSAAVTVAALQQAAKVAGCGVFATLLCVLVVNALGLSRAGLVSAPSARAGERTAESLAVVFLLIGVLAPLAEEMLFRGALFRKWRLHWRPGKVAVAMSGVFALGHSNAPSVFLFALSLTVLYTTTRTIWAPVTAHVLNNLLPLLAANTLHLVPADVLEAVVDWRWAPVAAVPALFATGWLIRFVSQGWGSLADPVDGVQLTPDPLPTVAELRQSIATTHSFEHTD